MRKIAKTHWFFVRSFWWRTFGLHIKWTWSVFNSRWLFQIWKRVDRVAFQSKRNRFSLNKRAQFWFLFVAFMLYGIRSITNYHHIRYTCFDRFICGHTFFFIFSNMRHSEFFFAFTLDRCFCFHFYSDVTSPFVYSFYFHYVFIRFCLPRLMSVDCVNQWDQSLRCGYAIYQRICSCHLFFLFSFTLHFILGDFCCHLMTCLCVCELYIFRRMFSFQFPTFVHTINLVWHSTFLLLVEVCVSI